MTQTFVPTAELLDDIDQLATIRRESHQAELTAYKALNAARATYDRANDDIDALLGVLARRKAIVESIDANLDVIEERGKVLVDGRWVDDPDDDGTLMGGLPWAERAIA